MEFEPLEKLPPLQPVKRSLVSRVKEALAEVVNLEDFRGRRGRRGARGLQGESITGDTGPTGESITGERGPRGRTGPQGDTIEGPPGERGLRGYKGTQGRAGEGSVGPTGPKGDTGPPPAHQWQGSALRFKKPNGDWGKAVNLQGPAGSRGGSGGGVKEQFGAIQLTGNNLEFLKQGAMGTDFVVDLSPIATGEEVLAQRIDEESGGNLLYIGEAQPGEADSAASWRIKRITFTEDVDGDTDSVTEWADGAATYTQIWDNHLALSYS